MKGLGILRSLTKGKKENHLANLEDLNNKKDVNHFSNSGDLTLLSRNKRKKREGLLYRRFFLTMK